MKFQVSFKTPSVLDPVIDKYVDTHCSNCEEHNLNCNDCLAIEERCCEKISKIQNVGAKFIRYGEYITVEFDADAGTATVIPL